MTRPSSHNVVLFVGSQALPFGMTLTSVSPEGSAAYARLAMQLQGAERAEILDSSGNMVDMLLKADRNPNDDRSSTDWGGVILPTGDGQS